jgi:thioredoxin reductase
MLETAIIGAGPYGLSIASHLRSQGTSFRIFGRLMDSWKAHMPKGMMLKSDGFASNIYDPLGTYPLKQFCAQHGIEYSDTGIPVRLETFAAYGSAFKDRLVPELEDKLVSRLDRAPSGFLLKLDDGEEVVAKHVILAVGITHFQHVPPNLRHLSPDFVSHSCCHHDLEPFRGRNVVVLGGGASATDLAGLLRDADAEVQLVARQTSLKFHGKPEVGKPRSLWRRIRSPQSGLGPGWRSRFFANAPSSFHWLPERLRLEIVRTHLGPSGGWFAKDKVVGRVPLLLGYEVERAGVHEGKVHVQLRAVDGTRRSVVTEHVIAATGYKADTGRLAFLSEEIHAKLVTVEGSPVLSRTFESSVPGLYFVGVAAASSFGPVMRFAFGAGFAARRLMKTMAEGTSRGRAVSSASRAVGAENERLRVV